MAASGESSSGEEHAAERRPRADDLEETRANRAGHHRFRRGARQRELPEAVDGHPLEQARLRFQS